ncbi:hypothetical protein HAZT_HAZT001867 [Hyalella azteca]|uniref:MAM domain-containing protein n=1 Tax=Hyalella azteca TaxID=294128 RepID=A0A6A0GZR5_HYAAZ|nr:hypothetical protein HAZT_HAZT001867 [Hyalella azteca]
MANNSFDWTRQFMEDPDLPEGTYMLADCTGRKIGEVSGITTPMLGSGGNHCLTFDYKVIGSEPALLQVYYRIAGSRGDAIWTRFDSPLLTWSSATVGIKVPDVFTLEWEIQVNGVDSVTLLDNILVTDAACPTSPTSCDFEFDDDEPTICSGHFVMANFSHAKYANEQAKLYAPVVPADEGASYCLTFWYQLITEDYTSFILRSNAIGDDTEDWVFGSAVFQGICDFEKDFCGWRNTGQIHWISYSLHPEETGPPTQNHIIFVAPEDSEPGVQAALASPYVRNRNCMNFWFKKEPRAPANFKIIRRTLGTSQIDEKNETIWELPTDWSDMYWQEDHGYWLGFQPATVGVVSAAHFTSPNFPSTEGTCITFDYYMNGADVKSLEVIVEETSSSSIIWRRDGFQSDDWIKGKVFYSAVDHKISFRTKTDGRIWLYVAIDNIAIIPGRCPADGSDLTVGGFCSFDDGLCGLTNSGCLDEHKWSDQIGPVSDHSTKSEFVDDISIEEGMCGDNAAYCSFEDHGSCLWSSDSNELQWFVTTTERGINGPTQSVDHGTKYLMFEPGPYHHYGLRTSLVEFEHYVIELEGKVGDGQEGSFSVDNLEVRYQDCPDGDQYYLTTPQYIGTNTRVTTSFSTEPIPGDADYCMSFQLHHTGLLPPTISIQQRGGGGSEQLIEIFHQVAPQADEWIDIFRTLAAENFQKPFVIDVLAMITNTSDGDVSIDNFQIALGACQEPTDACHFYEGFCGFTQDKDDDIDWHWHDGTGYEDIFAPFESIRHDSYIYVDTKAPHDSVARLLSPHFELQQQRCLSFDVHLHGLSAAPGIIQVWREDIGGIQPQLIKVVDGDQGLEWRHIYVPLMKGGTTRFIYEGILGPKEELYSSMGLDEIRLSDGACPDDLSCSSEHHPCGWYGEPQVNGSLWQKASGKQVSLWTRPIVDHTLQSSWMDFFWKLGNSASVKHQVPDKDYSETGTGLYAYADIYESISPNSRTQLVATLTSVTDSCLTFHYYLEGDHELVVTRVLNDRGEDLWRRGSPEPNWIFGQVNLDASSETSTIMFEAIHGRAALGAIALDNIAVEDGYCAERENWCDFESSEACGWTLAGVGSEDIIVWERLKDAMEDHTYQTRFGYVLAVNNKNGSTNKTALAKSSSISPYGWSCVRWWYIAKPETTSLLTVSFIPVDDNGTELRENAELLWSSMVTATEWSKGMISMTAFRYHLLFGASFFSTSEAIGIAIDDVYVDNGYCGLPGDCAFTGSSLCGWEVHDESSSYWLIQHGDDHTFGDDYYLRLAGKESSVTSPVISEDVYSNACLTFWYRMEQASTIEWFLQLVRAEHTTVGDTEKKPVWVDTDEMGTRGWRFGRTHLHLNESDWGARLVLRGTTEAYWEDSVVGVDDIQLFVGECSTVPLIADPSLPTESTTPETTAMTESTSPPLTQYDCDFEDFKKPYCDWYNAQGETCSWSTTGAPMLTSPPARDDYSPSTTMAIDDIYFTDGVCRDTYSCDFEHDMCFWENVYPSQMREEQMQWLIASPEDADFIGPSIDTTFKSAEGHYIILSGSFIVEDTGEAKLASKEFPQTNIDGNCLTFSYSMRGQSSLLLLVVATLSNDRSAFVAVDDLRFKFEPCSVEPPEASVVQQMYWINDETGQSNLVFSKSASKIDVWSLANLEIFADVDWTLSVKIVSEFMEELGVAAVDDTSSKIGNCENPPGDCDVEVDWCLWYNVQDLPLKWQRSSPIETPEGGTPVIDHDHTTGSPYGFYFAVQPDAPTGAVRSELYAQLEGPVIFSGIAEQCVIFWYFIDSDIGDSGSYAVLLDDIMILEEACPASDLSCSFEYSCGYFAGNERLNPWLIGRGVTEVPDNVTGPITDHTFINGMYAYTDFTSPAVTFTDSPVHALLESELQQPMAGCLRFYWVKYMKSSEGVDAPILSVHLISRPTNTIVDVVVLNDTKMSTTWTEQRAAFTSDGSEFVLVFNGTAFGRTSFIGIDDTLVWSGDCSDPPMPAPSAFPGKMLYRTSGGADYERAAIVSEPLLLPRACVRFFFYAYPFKAQKIQVFKKMHHRPDELIGEVTSPLANWLALRFYVEENEEWQLKFVAESMLNENSLVAIDDVVVSTLPCDERTSCDFEESICLWEDDSTHMWARGTEFGAYLYFYDQTNASSSQETVARIISETIPPSDEQHCFEAWVYLNGDNVGELRVNFLYPDGSNSVAEIIDPGLEVDKWRKVQVADDASQHWIYFEARGSGGPVDIMAVDSTARHQGNCTILSQDFVCENGKTISMDQVCDYNSDCSLEEDETVCATCYFGVDKCGWSAAESMSSPSMFYWDFEPHAPKLEVNMQNDGSSDSTMLYIAKGISENWQEFRIPLGHVADRFRLAVTFKPNHKTTETENLGAQVERILLENCDIVKEVVDTRSEGEFFHCADNRTCVPSAAVCDFNEDCPDASDEEFCAVERCSYEDRYEKCMWQNKGFTRVTAGKTGKLPYRDHTVNQGSGSYVLDEESDFIPMIYSNNVEPSQDCEFGFYSSLSGNLNVKLVIEIKEVPSQITIHTSEVVAPARENFGWQRTTRIFSSEQTTQIRIIGLNKWSEGVVALDDFFVSPKCKIGTAVTDPLDYSHTFYCQPSQFECETCIDYTKLLVHCLPLSYAFKVCDFKSDCNDGKDERSCGSTNFKDDAGSWQDASISAYHWERASAPEIGSSAPPQDPLNSGDDHYMWLAARGAGTPTNFATLVGPEMGPTALPCTFSFYSYGHDTIPSMYVYAESAGPIMRRLLYEFVYVFQANQWQHHEIHIGEQSDRFRVGFRVLKEGYIAADVNFDLFLDDFSFVGCSTEEAPRNGSFECTFSSPCSDLLQANDDSADWIPELDLFTLNDYLRLQSPSSQEVMADLKTWYRTPTRQSCFSFSTEEVTQYIWLDDVGLRDGPCPADLTCTFEEGDCGWHNDTVPEQEIPWLIVSSDTNTSLYDPPNTESGVGELTVLLDKGNLDEKLWSSSENSRAAWQLAQVTVKSAANFSLVIGANRHESNAGTMAVDDLTIDFDPCTNVVDCDFENGLCGWTIDTSTSVPWQLFMAQDNFGFVEVDHTLNSELGHYISFDSRPCQGSSQDCTATLTSAEVNPFIPTYCFSGYCFASNLDENSTVSLTVRSLTSNDSYTVFPIPTSVSNEDAWLPFSVTLTELTYTFQISLRAFASTLPVEEQRMVIMLDDLLLVSGACGEVTTQAPPTTTTMIPFVDLFTCDFEGGDACAWTVDDGWLLTNGENEKLVPWGPFSDHTTDLSSGGHMLVISDSGSSIQNVEVTSSYVTMPGDGICFSFYYFMHGEADLLLSLVVDEDKKSESFLAWQREGEVDNDWHQAYYYAIPEEGNVKVRIIFSAGYLTVDNRTGNIAIDDIVAHAGECAEQDHCDFEDHKSCGWQMPAEGNALAWLDADGLQADASPEIPSYDHTYGTSRGRFLYVHHLTADDLLYPRAYLYSPALSASENTLCLEMYYYMQGSKDWTGSLSAYVLPSGMDVEDATPVWTASGNRGANWARAIVETPVEESFQAAFDEETLNASIIALDDVKWTPGECPALGWCSFEDGTCGYTNDQTTDDLNWVVWRGDATDRDTGPAVDHTLGTDRGHYMLMDASVGTEGQQAILVLTDIPAGYYCFKFFFHIYGEDVGGLIITVVREDQTEHALLKIIRSTGNQWFEAAVDPFSQDLSFSLLLIATVGKGPLGDIAIDDTSLEYHCHDGTSIEFDLVCNFVEDCRLGEDESLCADCRFENTFCGWTRDSTTDHIWDLAQVSPSYGKSLYVAQQVAGEPGPALISSRDLHDAFTNCTFKFWYRSNPENGTSARLSVAVESSGGTAYVYHVINEGNDDWKEASVQIFDHYEAFQVTLEGETNASPFALTVDDTSMAGCTQPRLNQSCSAGQLSCQTSGLCIDEAYICDGTNDCGDRTDETNCNANFPLCDFEDDACSWNQEANKDDIDWIVTNGQTPAGLESFKTGPSTDHTTRLPEGKYLYITKFESSNEESKKAWLLSPTIQRTEDKSCILRFHYYMFGPNVQSVIVYKISGGNEQTDELFSVTGDQGQKWLRGTSEVTTSGPFRFAIEGTVKSLDFVDIAIDDISLSQGCVAAADVTTTTSTSTTTRVTPSPTTKITTPYTFPTSTTRLPPTTTAKHCPATTLDCGASNLTCVPGMLVCDSVQDCLNGADEEGCADGTPCGAGQMYCGGSGNQCVDRLQTLCNGVVQCPLYDADESICGECPPTYCINGGVCYVDEVTSAPECRCSPPYYGNRCELHAEGGLSGGAIAGIVIGVLLFIALLIAVAISQRHRFARPNNSSNLLSAADLDATDDTAYMGPDLPLHHLSDLADTNSANLKNKTPSEGTVKKSP